MKNLKYLVLVMVGMLAYIQAFAATASDYPDIVYARDVIAAAGGTVEVPVCLRNPGYKVKSLQFTMELPDGVSFVESSTGYRVTCDTLTRDWTINFRTQDGKSENTALLMMYYLNDATTAIAQGSDVCLFSISLKVADTVAVGTKTIALKDIHLTNYSDQSNIIISGQQSVTSAITINNDFKASDFADVIYAGDVVAHRGGTVDVPVYIKNPSYAVKGAQFTMALPDGVSFDEAAAGHKLTKNDQTKDWTIFFKPADGAAENTGLLLMFCQNDATTSIPQGDAELFNITLKVDEAAETGDRNIIMRNIILVDDKDRRKRILSGNGKLNSILTVKEYIDEDTLLIRGTVYEGCSTGQSDRSLANFHDCLGKCPNAVFVVGKDYSAKVQALSSVNKKNIVYTTDDGAYICDNFVLTDLKDFYAPDEFTAKAGSYVRTGMRKDAFASVCLPFELKSDDVEGAEILTFTQLNTTSVRLTSTTSLEAGIPCWLRCTTTDNLTVDLSGRRICGTASSSDIAKGSFMKQTIGGGMYKLNDDGDKFGITTEAGMVYPFRSYLALSGGAKADFLDIEFEEKPAAVEKVMEMDMTIGSIAVYDVNGIKRKTIGRGINIIKSTKGRVYKVVK